MEKKVGVSGVKSDKFSNHGEEKAGGKNKGYARYPGLDEQWFDKSRRKWKIWVRGGLQWVYRKRKRANIEGLELS